MPDKRALYIAMDDWRLAVDRVRSFQQQISDMNSNVAKLNAQISSTQQKLTEALQAEAEKFLVIEAAMK